MTEPSTGSRPVRLAEMRAAMRADWNRYVEDAVRDGGVRSIRRTVSQLGLQATIVYRFGRWLASHRAPWNLLLTPAWLLYAIAVTWVRAAYDIRLELGADIGPGLYIGHFGGIHVGRCVIGAACSMAQQTRIGPAADGTGPTIGRGVWVGAHVTITGSIVVGAGATIAAGASVVADVPPGVLLLGNPPRTLPRERFPARPIFQNRES